MLRNRTLVSLLLAAMLALGTIGSAFADDSGGDRVGDESGTSAVVSDAAL